MESNQRPNFSKKYRPKKFGEVRGQDEAVACVSGLITRGKLERNLLLHGSVGSGKTTLVRLYARALNCMHPEEDGSPCGTCKFCTELRPEHYGLHEYDVPGRGGKEPNIRAFVLPLDQTPRDLRARVIFFDEAHHLENDAADFLLKRVEEPKEGVIFCFATTEFSKLRPALRSRLLDFEVRPLSASASIDFLREIADKEHIEYEPEALALIAGVKQGYPRDLLGGLEQLWRPEGTIDVPYVQRFFGIDHAEVLAKYFRALVRGDISEQLDAIWNWREPATDKARWIRAFLLSLYYNEILGLSLVVDPLVQTLRRERAEIISRFCARLHVRAPLELVEFCRGMLQFWEDAPSELPESDLLLRLTLFHDRVVQLASSSSIDTASTAREPEPSRTRSCDAPSPPLRSSILGELFSTWHAREVINRTSFMTQAYGCLFNSRIEIAPIHYGIYEEAKAYRLLREFLHDLDGWSPSAVQPEAAPLTWIAVIDRDSEGYVYATVLAHVPPSEQRSSTNTARLKDWCAAWRADQRAMEGSISFDVAGANVLRWHWREVFRLCDGLHPDEHAPGERGRTLRDVLKLGRRPRRQGGPISEHMIIFSGHLQDAMLDSACENRMDFLSAFDDSAWETLAKGWELQEFHDRRRVAALRAQEMLRLRMIYASDADRMAAEIQRLIESWPADPRRRERSWAGWWLGADV